jgi:GNAT superfamily N-acetyltransferase
VSVDVRPVHSRGDLKRFIKLPMRLYRNEPNWVPPLMFERRRFLDRAKNPYFHHAEAEYFLAWRDGEPVGRITAQVDRNFNDHHGARWGNYGFFEAEDDAEVAGALFSAAESWLRERGMERMVGPFDFTMNDECGLLVEGHERRPMVKQPWQPPYYRALFEDAGMRKAIDLFMWELRISDRQKLLPVLFELAEKLEPEHGIRVRHMRKRDLEDEIRRFQEIYNVAWKDNWGFVPLTYEELLHTAKESKPLLDEDWMMAADTEDGETVAIALTVPDANQALARMGGRLLPFGWLKLLLGIRKIDAVRVGFLGVKPEYQHTGVAAGLYVEHFDMAERTPKKWGEMGWILETNTAMNRGMEAMGGRVVKRYRVYEKPFDGAAPLAAD